MTYLFLAVVLLMIIGALGTFLPIIPGAPLAFGAALVYAIADKFQHISVWTIIALALLTIISLAIDYFSGVWGAKKYGGSQWGVWGAIIGAVLGVIFLQLIGLIIGPFIGSVVAELLTGKKMDEALKVGWGTLIGLLGGGVLKFILGLVMVIVFVWDKVN